jgi:hypothetical protein
MKPNNLTLHRLILFLTVTALAILGIFGCGIISKTPFPSPSDTIEMEIEPTKEMPESAMGPYDVAVIPLEDVPEPDPSRVYWFSIEEEKGLAIFRIFKDPRNVPLERFLYFNTRWRSSDIEGIPSGLVEHRDAEDIIDRFKDDGHIAVAVYVELTTEDYPQKDRLYVIDPHKDPWDEGDMWSPWSGLAVVDPESDLRLPCMPQQIADAGEAYRIPETGERFDPTSYLPPKPWYPQIAPTVEPGEIREGWILCLAPDIPMEDIRIVIQHRDRDEENYFAESVAWTKLSSSQMGDWVLLENAEVIGWQKPTNKYAQRIVGDGYVRYEPSGDTSVIYEGPVWMSISMGRIYDYGQIPTDTKRLKINLQFYFDGMEDLLKEWDRIALKKNFNVVLYSDVYMNNRIGTIPEVQVHATDFWLNFVIVPGNMETAWVKILESEGPDIWKTIIPVWRLDFVDSTEEITSTEDFCGVTECFDLNQEVYDRHRDRLFSSPWEELDGPAPIIPFDQFAMGFRISGITITEDPYLFSANGPDLRKMDPRHYDDRMLIVEFENKYGEIGQLPHPNHWDVHCIDGDVIEYMGYLKSKPLQGELDGVFATSGLMNSDIRGVTKNGVLIGEIKGACPVEDILIFKDDTGPAWRIHPGSSETVSAVQVESITTQDMVQETVQETGSAGLQGPALSVGERLNLAFPYKPSGIYNYLSRNVANDVPEWPEMHYLGEDVQHYGTTLKLVDYMFKHGGPVPKAWIPILDDIDEVPDGIDYTIGFNLIPYIAIPPQTTLLLVKLEVDPPFDDIGHGRSCVNATEGLSSPLRSKYLRLAYPGLGETQALLTDNVDNFVRNIFDYGEYNFPDSRCLLDGWYYFYIADPDPDPTKIWVMHVPRLDPSDILIWTLAERNE